ncbi:MAG: hypothetical protein IKE43_12035 [Coriobacteriales bacterium]|nr:hypothetical protein [Coriobacteriales bacterium]
MINNLVNNGLNLTEWIENNNHCHIEGFEKDLIGEFLLSSPALEVTARSNGFIERFKIVDSVGADVLFNHLTRDIDLCLVLDSSEKLKDKLEEKKLLYKHFWEKSEFILMTCNVPNNIENYIKENYCVKHTGLAKERNKMVLTSYKRLDALFRHIRNSLAHGLYSSFGEDDNQIWVFQDHNQDQNISARLVLKQKRIHDWITDFCRFETEGV